jgi:hypothetical protein
MSLSVCVWLCLSGSIYILLSDSHHSTQAGLPRALADQAKTAMAEALANGAFHAVCREASSLLQGEREKRVLSKKLVHFTELVRTRGGPTRKLEQLAHTLQPHMSLPLFADLVEADDLAQEWTTDNLVGLATSLFRTTSSPAELKAFEDKLLYY